MEDRRREKMSEGSEVGYETALEDDKRKRKKRSKKSRRRSRRARSNSSSDSSSRSTSGSSSSSSSDGHRGPRMAPHVVTIPKAFQCSRCAKCKYQSKGTLYCRVNQLHLWAPGWDEPNQKKCWDPPPGFLKWLRKSGPVVGCKSDDDVRELSLENPLFLDYFPWYRSAGWGPKMFEHSMFGDKKNGTSGEGRIGDAGDYRRGRRTRKHKHRRGSKSRKRRYSSSSASSSSTSSSSLSSLSSSSSSPSLSSSSPPLALTRAKRSRAGFRRARGDSNGSGSGISDSGGSDSGGGGVNSGDSSYSPSPSRKSSKRGGAERKKKARSKGDASRGAAAVATSGNGGGKVGDPACFSSARTAVTGWQGNSDVFVRNAVPNCRTSGSSVAAAPAAGAAARASAWNGNGEYDSEDVTVANLGGSNDDATPRSPPYSSSVLHSMAPPSSEKGWGGGQSPLADSGGGAGAGAGAAGVCSFRIERSAEILDGPAGRWTGNGTAPPHLWDGGGTPGAGYGIRGAGSGGGGEGSGGAGVPGDKRGLVHQYHFAEAGSPRGKGCAEGVSGSAWKGIDPAALASGDSGSGTGTLRHEDLSRAGRQGSATPQAIGMHYGGSMPPTTCRPDGQGQVLCVGIDVDIDGSRAESNETRLLALWDRGNRPTSPKNRGAAERAARDARSGMAKREDEERRATEKQRRVPEQQKRIPAASRQQRSADAERHRRTLEPIEIKRNKCQMQEETELMKAKAAEQREEKEARKHKAVLRRNQLAYWVQGRPALGKVQLPDSKLITPPIIPQDHYRSALQKLVQLDDPFSSAEGGDQDKDQAKPPPPPSSSLTSSSSSSLVALVAPVKDPVTPAPAPPCPRDYHYYYQLGGAGAEQQPQQRSRFRPHVPPATVPVGLIVTALTSWQQETKRCLEEEWPSHPSTEGITSVVRPGNVRPGGRWGEAIGRSSGAAQPQQREATAAATRTSGLCAQRRELELRAAKSGRSSDFRRVLQGISEEEITNNTREALRSRLHMWAREIPIFVEQGGEVDTAVSEIPLNMSVVRATIGPGESIALAGKSLDNWRGLVPITPEKEQDVHSEPALGDGTQDAPLHVGGDAAKGYPPLASGGGSAVVAVTMGRERHRLYDLHGGGGGGRDSWSSADRDRSSKDGSTERSKEGDARPGEGRQVAAEGAIALREHRNSLGHRFSGGRGCDYRYGGGGGGGAGVGGGAGACGSGRRSGSGGGSGCGVGAATGLEVRRRDPEVIELTGEAVARRSSAPETSDVVGASAGASGGTGGPPVDSLSGAKRHRSNQLPPGWTIERSDQPGEQGYWCVFKNGEGSGLQDVRFRSLREVQDFLSSDLPAAEIHRRSIENRKSQMAVLEGSRSRGGGGREAEEGPSKTAAGQDKGMKKDKKERGDKRKRRRREDAQDARDRFGKGLRVSHHKRSSMAPPKYHGWEEEEEGEDDEREDGGGSSSKIKRRHANDHESRKDKKRSKKHDNIAKKLVNCLEPGLRGPRSSSEHRRRGHGDKNNNAAREARREAKRAGTVAAAAAADGDGQPAGGQVPLAGSDGARKQRPLGSKNEEDVAVDALNTQKNPGARVDMLVEEKRGEDIAGAGVSCGHQPSKGKGQASDAAGGGEPRDGMEDTVEREIREIVGAYSDPEARKVLLAQLRAHAHLQARDQQRGEGKTTATAGSETGGRAKGAEYKGEGATATAGETGREGKGEQENEKDTAALTTKKTGDRGDGEQGRGTAVTATDTGHKVSGGEGKPEEGKDTTATINETDGQVSGIVVDSTTTMMMTTTTAMGCEGIGEQVKDTAATTTEVGGEGNRSEGENTQTTSAGTGGNKDSEQEKFTTATPEAGGEGKGKQGKSITVRTGIDDQETGRGEKAEEASGRNIVGVAGAASSEKAVPPTKADAHLNSGRIGGQEAGRQVVKQEGGGTEGRGEEDKMSQDKEKNRRKKWGSEPRRTSPRVAQLFNVGGETGGGATLDTGAADKNPGAATPCAAAADKKKGKAGSLSPNGDGKRQSFGKGRGEVDEIRRHSSRAASAAATAAIAGNS